ncbi:hypothetical protein [Thalassospira alkalitolerans]|uniref:hypothetical protein n=1 Tax=Thalassospira alkalitolerans TaxID=1293890 RepID=UPI003AA7AEFD
MFELQDHRVYCLHSLLLEADETPGSNFAGLTKQPVIGGTSANPGYGMDEPAPVWLPEKCRPAAKSHFADVSLLRETSKPCGGDLYAPVRGLISGETPSLCRVYTLSEQFQNFLARGVLYEKDVPAEERFQYQLAMVLSGAARKRFEKALSEDDMPTEFLIPARKPDGAMGKDAFVVPIEISGFDLYQFATGRVVCQLSLKARMPDGRDLPSPLLTELVSHAGRFAKLGWIEHPPSILQAKKSKGVSGAEGDQMVDVSAPVLLDGMDEFTLGGFVNRIVRGPRGRAARSMRTYTHAFAMISKKSTGQVRGLLEEFGKKLARQYTDDYALSADADGLHEVADFDNVVHILSREGGASIVDPFKNGEKIPFLSDFRQATLEKNYLPISVLNVHQHARSLDLLTLAVKKGDEARELDVGTGTVSAHDAIEDEKSVLRAWDKMQDDVTLLNSRFRFHQISPVSMHNRFSMAQRLALGLDELEKHLSADLADMSMRIQALVSMRSQARQQRFDRWFWWVPIVGSGVLTGILVLEIVTAVFDMRESGFDIWELGALAVAAAITIGATWFAFHKRKIVV